MKMNSSPFIVTKRFYNIFHNVFILKKFYKKISPQITLKRNLMLFISYDWFPNVECEW